MTTMGEVLERNALHAPDRTAILFEGKSISYARLLRQSTRLANALLGGAAPGDRVAILAMNCPEYIEAYGAGELAGFIMVGINFRLAAAEIAYILEDSAPRVLIFESQYADLIASLRPNLPEDMRLICLDQSDLEWAEAYEKVVASGSDTLPAKRPCLDDPLGLLYTSGTTGRPKGALRSNRADAFIGEVYAMELNLAPGDRMLIMMPMFHAGGRGQQMAIFWRGATLVLHRGFDAAAVLRSIEEDRVAVTHMAPTVFQDIIDHPDFEARDLSSLKTLLYAAAPMPLPLLRRGLAALGPIFVNGYGCSESAGAFLHKTDHVLDGPRELVERLKSVGQPLVRTHIRIVDEAGNELPTGMVGEIAMKSDGTMMRYWNNDRATAEVLHDGWYRTGDMAYVDAQNFVFLVDRKKDMIVSGGENIYSREVEEALLTHAAVADVAVIGIPDPRWGESVRAVIVRVAECQVAAEELITHCRAQIARYKAPKSIVFVDTLPRLGTGKIDKVSIRRLHGTPF